MSVRWLISKLRHLLLVSVFVCCGCREQILHDLSEAEANRLLTRLHEAQITASKAKQADGRWAVEVKESEVFPALKFLDNARLTKEEPREAHEQNALLASREEQRYRLETALASKIEATLRSIDGVLEARVHLNLPPVDPLFGQRIAGAKGSGSVLVISRAESALDQAKVSALVAGTAGISAESIAVLISPQSQSEPAAAVVVTPEAKPEDLAEQQGVIARIRKQPNLQLALLLLVLGAAGCVSLSRGSTKKARCTILPEG